jgi:short-chain fatty acids transporter
LVVGGIVVLNIARQLQQKSVQVDYPLLVASAYSGFVVWHMGLNGVAPLFMATADNEMLHITGRLIPVNETILAPWNVFLAFLVLVSVSAVCVLMRPVVGKEKAFVESERLVGQDSPVGDKSSPLTPVDLQSSRLSWHCLPTLTLGCLVMTYLVVDVGFGMRSIDFDVIIWALLSFGLILSGGTQNFSRLAVQGGASVAPILIQYPLYAGVMVLLSESGAVSSMSNWVVGFASAKTLGVFAFLSAGVVNFLIPSGGAQWVMQGPIFLEAGKTLGVDYPIVIMAIAYGDQWSNMIQPFWALPLLAIAGLSIGDIFRYLLVIFAVSGLIMGIGIYTVSATGG